MVGKIIKHPRSREVDEGSRLHLQHHLGISPREELTPILRDGAHGLQALAPVVHHGEKHIQPLELAPISRKIGTTKIGLIGMDGTTSRKKSGEDMTGIPLTTPIIQTITGPIEIQSVK